MQQGKDLEKKKFSKCETALFFNKIYFNKELYKINSTLCFIKIEN